MDKISVSNRRSTMSKLTFIAGIAAISLVSYAGVSVFNAVSDGLARRSNKSQIEDLIRQEKIGTAKQLFEQYKVNDGLSTEIIINLSDQIKEAENRLAKTEALKKRTDIIYQLITLGDAKKAQSELDDLRRNHPNERHLDELELKIQEFSEDGLYKRISTMTGTDRIPLCEKYLSKYPEGAYRKQIVEKLFLSHGQNLEILLQDRSDYQAAYSQLVAVEDILGKYSTDLAEVKGTLTPLFAQENQASDKKTTFYNKASIEKLTVGSNVRVLNDAKTDVKQTYLLERNSLVAHHTEGLIELIKGDDIYVKFPGKKIAWSNSWGFDNLWTDDSKNVALYKIVELQSPFSLSLMQRQEYMLLLGRIQKQIQGGTK